MKNVLFLAHDPGGYDVIWPLANRMLDSSAHNRDWSCQCLLVGPSAALNPDFASSEEQLEQAIERLPQQSVLVCGTSWGTEVELRAISLCRKRNITTVAVLDYWSNYKLRFRKRTGQFVFPDYYVVMDDLAYEEAVLDGIPESILRILGHPGLDRWVHASSNEKPRAATGGMNILFLSQPLSLLYGNQLGFTEQTVLADIWSSINNSVGDCLRIKFHPKDDIQWQAEYKHLTVTGDLYQLMPQYDVIISMNSIALLHAHLIGRIGISYQPGLQGADVAISNKLGFTRRIADYSDLLQELENCRERLTINCSQRSLMNDNDNDPLWIDGRSTERVIRFLEEVPIQ